MKIEPTLKSSSFAEAANGSVLLATIREREIVQGVKAFHVGSDGAPSAFFVTIGPFFEEHGPRPIVYSADDIGTDMVIDTSLQTRLTYSLRPEDLEVKSPEAAAANPTIGELLFTRDKDVLTVANFGRAGPADLAYLDLESGELSDLPAGPQFFSLSQWRVEMRNDAGETIYAQDFATSS